MTLTLVIIIWRHLGKWPEKRKQNRFLSPFLVILSCQKEPNISYHNGICNPPPSDYVLKPGEKWVFRSTSTVPVVIVIYLLTLWPLSTLCEHSNHLSCLKQGIQTCTSLLWKRSTIHLPQSSGWYSNASWMMVFLDHLVSNTLFIYLYIFSLVRFSPAKTIYILLMFNNFYLSVPICLRLRNTWLNERMDFWPQASSCNVSSQCLLFGWFSLLTLKTTYEKLCQDLAMGGKHLRGHLLRAVLICSVRSSVKIPSWVTRWQVPGRHRLAGED